MSLPDPAPEILITRPAAQAGETAARVRALGYAAVLAPLLEIETYPVTVPAGSRAVLITSANALPALLGCDRAMRLFAVGDATAAAARAAGFADARSAGGDAAALAARVGRSCDSGSGPLCLVSGAGQGGALRADLAARGFTVLARTGYAARPAVQLPEAAVAAFARGQLAAALFFSRETAAAFVNLVDRHRPALRKMMAVAIGHQAASVLGALPWRCVEYPKRPTQDEMLAFLDDRHTRPARV
jgi:uroporphyrinogen-III synthase